MTDYPHLLTDGQVDTRKVRKLSLAKARHQRDIAILVAARVSSPALPLSRIAAWRQIAARKLMIAGWCCADVSTIWASTLASTQEDAEIAARRVAPSSFQIAAE